MPTYVYECRKCSHRFELLQGITDPPRRRCPQCRGAVKRIVMPGGGLVFKGSGFYITDYKRKEKRGAGELSSESSSETSPPPAKEGDAGPSSSSKEKDAD